MNLVKNKNRCGKNNPMYGKKRPLSVIEKIKEKLIGRKYNHPDSCNCPWCRAKRKEFIGKNNPQFKGGKPICLDCGTKLTARNVLRCRKCYDKFKIGKNNPNWQGGKSLEQYGYDFNKDLKEQVRKRDKYKCKECGKSEKKLGYTLICHHIDYNKKNNNPKNLISLCSTCHGKTNFKRSDWIKYFKNKQNEKI